MRGERQKEHSNKVMKSVIASLCCLAAIYLGMSLYSINHFYFGTKIEGINIGGKTVKEAEEILSSKMQAYTLELDERENKKEVINGSNIGIKYDADKIKKLKDSQNPFSWISSIFNKDASKVSEVFSYNDDLLNNLSCVNNKDITKPKSARFEFEDGKYVIVNEVLGNKINKDVLGDKITDAINNGETSINLDTANCYENPKYTSKSKEVIDTLNTLNKYVGLKVTYNSHGKNLVIDGSTINKWIKVNKNMEITFDKHIVRNTINRISHTFNTFGSTRDFVTTTKKAIKVSGGTYGYVVDKSKEAKDLIAAVKSGQDVTKEPAYNQIAASKGSNDIGNTYVEVNLTKQHVWFYKNGILVVDGDVVTGNISRNRGTPTGTYVLNYKDKDAILKGQDYNSPVTYWMPFYNNVGLHDASWRHGHFGGDIYKTRGSHGCVNCPLNLAKTIFENIVPGTPVVVFNE